MGKKHGIAPYEIENYLKGRGDSALKERVEKWLAESGHTKEATGLLYDLWKSTDNGLSKEEAGMAFAKFKARIGVKSVSPFRRIARRAMQAAAVLLIATLSYISFFANGDSGQVNWTEKYVAWGTKEELLLPDGSHLWLNSGTHIIYPEKFGKKSREIFITGEAYMDIARDTERPFVVSTGGISVRVLGTRFNLKSYVEDDNVVVNLLEGSVSLSEGDESNGTVRVLEPGEVASYDKTNGEFAFDTFSPDNFKSWIDGHLFFRNERLGNIAAHLERRFNVKIVIADRELRDRRYRVAFLNNETLEQMLDAFDVDGNMESTRKNDLIEIEYK